MILSNIRNMVIRIIQHELWLDGGEYISWANRHNYELVYTKCFEYEPIPTKVDADMLIILGGPQNPAMSKKECPYFDAAKERELILSYVLANRVVIGSCLGAQLIGEALGAKYSHSPYPEVGYIKGVLTEEGKKEKYFLHFPNTMNIGGWHYDMPGLTGKAVVIMKSEGCPRQIVKYSQFVYGFQAHIEFNHQSYVNGLKHNNDALIIKSPYICGKEDILSFDTTEMNKALSLFLDKITKDYLKTKKYGFLY